MERNMKKSNLEENISKSMTSIRWDYPMEKAWLLMEERNIRHLPIRGDDGALVGILSDRDIKRAMNPNTNTFNANAIAAEYMSQPVITVEKNTAISKVAKIMIEGKISSLLVTEGSDIVGIVTSEDLLRLLWTMLQESEEKNSIHLGALKYEPIWREVLREASAAGI